MVLLEATDVLSVYIWWPRSWKWTNDAAKLAGASPYAGGVSADRKLVTAAELDAMSPDERAAVVSERIVTDLDEFAPAFRDRVLTRP